MRSTLYLKFLLIYIVFGFLTLFTAATLTENLTRTPVFEETCDTIFEEETKLANDYFPQYFSNELTLRDVNTQLNGISTQLDVSVWLLDESGNVMASEQASGYPAPPATIEDFDPARSGNATYVENQYQQYFNKDTVSFTVPVLYGYTPKGYLIIHKYEEDMYGNASIYMHAIYITLLVIYLLSFVFLLGFHFLVYVPLCKVTEAAKQYASGNLSYQIPVHRNDEMGYLSASLNYMSAQLRDMEDYQKKFIANVSHDFRSPLTSIKGYVEAMADGVIPPELYDKYLKIILFETERLTDLTTDLLTLNEYDRQNLVLNREMFDLHEMIKNVSLSFEGRCKERKISIELIFSSKYVKVYADKRKIQQVLYNLLDNAIKFSPDNSSIIIETTERGEKVYTSVKDYGIGIPRNALNKVWERFYKSDLSRGKDKKGTGLGLAIVKEAINAHGENINVISTEGVGTEFIFSLPKNVAAASKTSGKSMQKK